MCRQMVSFNTDVQQMPRAAATVDTMWPAFWSADALHAAPQHQPVTSAAIWMKPTVNEPLTEIRRKHLIIISAVCSRVFPVKTHLSTGITAATNDFWVLIYELVPGLHLEEHCISWIEHHLLFWLQPLDSCFLLYLSKQLINFTDENCIFGRIYQPAQCLTLLLVSSLPYSECSISCSGVLQHHPSIFNLRNKRVQTVKDATTSQQRRNTQPACNRTCAAGFDILVDDVVIITVLTAILHRAAHKAELCCKEASAFLWWRHLSLQIRLKSLLLSVLGKKK